MYSLQAYNVMPAIATLCVVLGISGMFWFRGYTGLTWRVAILALLGGILVTGYVAYQHFLANFEIMHRAAEMHGRRMNDLEVFLPSFAAGSLVLFMEALVLRLWGRWVGEKSTAEERLPGKAGVRAWFNFGNVAVCLVIVICAWFGYRVPMLASAGALATILAAAPLLRLELPKMPNPEPVDGMSAEREKILSMLESGKITADESAELLHALGASAPPPPPRSTPPLSAAHRLVLVGAALVTLGFFLPWFVIPTAEMKEIVGMLNQFEQSIGNQMGLQGDMLPNLNMRSSVSVSGGEIGRGLGWAILGLALAAALLPYLVTTLQDSTARKMRLLCLGIGALIALFLLTQAFQYAGVGLMIAMGGYIMEIAGMLREQRMA